MQKTGNFGANEALIENATLSGLPDKAFFKSFTARRRREMVYEVHAETPGMNLILEVHGSGAMKARVTMPSIVVEDGIIERYDEETVVCWAKTGEQAVVQTRLDHRHLQTVPLPGDVMSAFLDAIGTHTRAVCPGGYQQWKSAMQLLANRVAREKGVQVEVVAIPPMPPEHETGDTRRVTHVEIQDITDPEAPVMIKDYEAEMTEIDEAMTPEAMSIMLLPPGMLVSRRHREIFQAG